MLETDMPVAAGVSADKAAEIAVTADGGAPVFVNADAATIRQALGNVIHNAIRYTPSGGRVDVVVRRADDGGAVIDVIDDGPGIPAGEREKVFDRFYRLDEARTAVGGGAGLGLAIARWGVAANGGSIAFVDKQGPGAHCRIILPANPD
jgi:signal transduction histidine kinase